jgi:hypothetical protein
MPATPTPTAEETAAAEKKAADKVVADQKKAAEVKAKAEKAAADKIMAAGRNAAKFFNKINESPSSERLTRTNRDNLKVIARQLNEIGAGENSPKPVMLAKTFRALLFDFKNDPGFLSMGSEYQQGIDQWFSKFKSLDASELAKSLTAHI